MTATQRHSSGSAHCRDNRKKASRRGLLTRTDVTKLDYEDASPWAVLCNLQQIHKASETAASRKLRSYFSERDFEELGDDDLAGRQGIMAPDLHMRPLPQANGGRDLAATNAVPKGSNELHVCVR